MSLITGIQKYSIHDGDGIRTTVFFKGCHLNCRWCHNPETKSFKPQIMIDKPRCTSCGACESVCPRKAIKTVSGGMKLDYNLCNGCGICVDSCMLNLREIAGKDINVSELIKEIRKDEMFYEESGGGVTLSGGEVMAADMEFLEDLIIKLNRTGISITIDTCGQAPTEHFERVVPYVDTFLFDIKLMNEEKHREYIGASNKLILANLEYLNSTGTDIYIRIPVIEGVNAELSDMQEIIDYLKSKNINPAKINLLPYHNTGSGKYEKLGEKYQGKAFETPSDEAMETFAYLFENAGFHNVKIGG